MESRGRIEVGETVYHKGQKWEVADHLNGTYCLWVRDATGRVVREKDGWIHGSELARTEGK